MWHIQLSKLCSKWHAPWRQYIKTHSIKSMKVRTNNMITRSSTITAWLEKNNISHIYHISHKIVSIYYFKTHKTVNITCYRTSIFMSSWWRHQMETFYALLAPCVGNPPVTGEFPTQRPVARRFDVFVDLRLIKRLSKQSWGWWFETPSRSLWRHYNVFVARNSPSAYSSSSKVKYLSAMSTGYNHFLCFPDYR